MSAYVGCEIHYKFMNKNMRLDKNTSHFLRTSPKKSDLNPAKLPEYPVVDMKRCREPPLNP